MRKFFKILWKLILIAILVVAISYFKTHFFNDYVRVRKNESIEFRRSIKMEGSKQKSYMIHADNYSNGLFYKTVAVEPNKNYRVRCFIKTEDVSGIDNEEFTGANICLYGDGIHSDFIKGTNDFQEVSLYFNSKNKTEVNIAFRLGNDYKDARGTAYFTDIKFEESTASLDTKWKFCAFIFKNLDVKIGDKEYKEEMTDEDISLIEENLSMFKNDIATLSQQAINAEIDRKYIDASIDKISHDDTNGYYIDLKDIYKYVKDYIVENNYDHIFIIFKSDALNKEDLTKSEEQDWIGLGGMIYNQIGYSNIRIPDENNKGRYMVIYNSQTNRFPDEVFIHEFLHYIERVSNELNRPIPVLHNYKDFNYRKVTGLGLKTWYGDYMSHNVDDILHGTKVGVDKTVYHDAKLSKREFFENPKEIEFDGEPHSIAEFIDLISRVAKDNYSKIKQNDDF